MKRDVIVQLGVTSDFGSHYATAAHTLGFTAWLLDTGERLAESASQLADRYDRFIALPRPTLSSEVLNVLSPIRDRIGAVVSGCDPCHNAAHHAAIALGAGVPSVDAESVPGVPGKALQRVVAKASAPRVFQPGFLVSSVTRACADVRASPLRYPLVLKPIRGSGGAGVCLVTSPTNLRRAAAAIGGMHDRYGHAYLGLLIEEFIPGVPCSVQGLAVGGEARLYTCTDQIVVNRPAPFPGAKCGFDECGHVVRPSASASLGLRNMAQQIISAIGYRNGPFYLDLIRSKLKYYFIEAGLRLSSSGVVDMVNEVAGVDWACQSIAALSGTTCEIPTRPPARHAMGRILIGGEAEHSALRSLLDTRPELNIDMLSRPGGTLVTIRHLRPTVIKQTLRKLVM